jgi:hypothetical protein
MQMHNFGDDIIKNYQDEQSRIIDLEDGSYRVHSGDGLIVQADKLPSSEEMIANWWQSIYERSGGQEVFKKAVFDLKAQMESMFFDMREEISQLKVELKKLKEEGGGSSEYGISSDDYRNDIMG